MYPEGEPINLLIVCDSLYSLESILITLLDILFAKSLAKDVLPTPVGPLSNIE